MLIFAFSLNLSAQSWANTEKYQEENKNMGSPGTEEKRVVFMGNSITEGWSNYMPDFFMQNFYFNRGISGQTTSQMLVRFRPDVIELKPKIVVILSGTNDIAENNGTISLEIIMSNIISMAELAKLNNIDVILCSVLPAYDYPWRQGLEPAEKIVKLNQMIKSYANENKLVYVDYFTKMEDGKNGLKSKYTYDGVHPNFEGYRVMASLVQDAINKCINKIK